MKLMHIEKISQGKFLNGYKATYENAEGGIKEYELVSRNGNLTTESFGHTANAAAVGIIAFNKSRTRILLAREFRLACNKWIYNFPGGLINPGETPMEAAIRELDEETGLNMIDLLDVMYPSFSAVGVCDEQVHTVICVADSNFKSSTSTNEEIIARWYTKTEILNLLSRKVPMAQRTQTFLWMWCFGNNLI